MNIFILIFLFLKIFFIGLVIIFIGNIEIMKCTSPISVNVNKANPSMRAEYVTVGCGKCTSCRVNVRKEWSLRMQHQLHYSKDALFVTLTYDDEHLPENGSLRKIDLQLFFKRLRKSIYPKLIKYFSCGEYGGETLRPHYHAIIFNMTMDDIDHITSSWTYCDWTVNSIRQQALKIATPGNIEYVAGYIHSKLSGRYADLLKYRGEEPEFRLSSQGIGKQYALDNAERLKQDLYISHYNVKRPIPRYYRKILGITDQDYAETLAKLDLEDTESLIGINIESDLVHKLGHKVVVEYNRARNRRFKQSDKNIKANLRNKNDRNKI